jgi:hypothetical protein
MFLLTRLPGTCLVKLPGCGIIVVEYTSFTLLVPIYRFGQCKIIDYELNDTQKTGTNKITTSATLTSLSNGRK